MARLDAAAPAGCQVNRYAADLADRVSWGGGGGRKENLLFLPMHHLFQGCAACADDVIVSSPQEENVGGCDFYILESCCFVYTNFQYDLLLRIYKLPI